MSTRKDHEMANERGEITIPYAVVEYVTLKNILNVYDALGIDRLRIELVEYDRSSQRSLKRAYAYVPLGQAKLMIHMGLSGQVADGWKLETFGGGQVDGQIESRTFKVEYDTAQGRFAANPWRITIAMGPGARNKTGGIQPQGEPHTRVQMRFPVDHFLIHLLEIRDYLANHQSEVESVRRREQLQHYAERQGAKQSTPPARQASASRS